MFAVLLQYYYYVYHMRFFFIWEVNRKYIWNIIITWVFGVIHFSVHFWPNGQLIVLSFIFSSFSDSNFLCFLVIQSKVTIHYLYEISIISSCVFDTSLPSSMVTGILWHFSLLLPQESDIVTAQEFSCYTWVYSHSQLKKIAVEFRGKWSKVWNVGGRLSAHPILL